MKKIIFILSFYFFACVAFAQDGYVKGYVIKINGDTVRGKIKDRKEPKAKIGWQKINFINSADQKEKFSAEDMRGYVKLDTIEFRVLALGVEGKRRVLKIVESGAVILFSYNLGMSQNGEPEYYLQKEKDVNSLMQWREGDYKRTSSYFFKDDKELMKLIETEALKEKDIIAIVKKYNQDKEK